MKYDYVYPGGAAGYALRPSAPATWWIEAQWSLAETMWAAKTQAAIRERIRQGPPFIR